MLKPVLIMLLLDPAYDTLHKSIDHSASPALVLVD
jgi:hypothetical protein